MNIDIEIYVTPAGKKPFFLWEKKLNVQTRAIVTARLARLKLGLFGDCKVLKNSKGLYELRIHHGSGYRVYFGRKKEKIIILLCGGDKGTQKRDIQKAKEFWEEYLNG